MLSTINNCVQINFHLDYHTCMMPPFTCGEKKAVLPQLSICVQSIYSIGSVKKSHLIRVVIGV